MPMLGVPFRRTDETRAHKITERFQVGASFVFDRVELFPELGSEILPPQFSDGKTAGDSDGAFSHPRIAPGRCGVFAEEAAHVAQGGLGRRRELRSNLRNVVIVRPALQFGLEVELYLITAARNEK